MDIKVYFENKRFVECIKYSFETLLRCISISGYRFVDADVIISDGIYYGNNVPNDFKGLVIKPGKLFSENYLKEESLPIFPIQYVDDLPVLYPTSNTPCISTELGRTVIDFDIVQGTYFCVTGYEEIVSKNIERDIHSRVLCKEKTLFKVCKFEKPVVNMYAKLLQKCLLDLNLVNKEEIVERRPIAHISHDVDRPFKHQPFYLINKYMKKKIGMQFPMKLEGGFDYIRKVEKGLDVTSSWFFMVGGNNVGYDFCYDINDKAIQKLIQKLESEGKEIGWHYSYECGTDPFLFGREAEKFKAIRSKLFGRNHYLRYRIPESWRVYSQSDILYDSSLGNSGYEGFAYGICTPFELFDAVERKNTNVWEIPLILMDGTVCTPANRKIDEKEANRIFDNLVQEVIEYNGVFSFLWHNTSIYKKGWKQWHHFYKSSMKKLAESFECLTGEEIIKRFS